MAQLRELGVAGALEALLQSGGGLGGLLARTTALASALGACDAAQHSW